jgi:hypothetical protein
MEAGFCHNMSIQQQFLKWEEVYYSMCKYVPGHHSINPCVFSNCNIQCRVHECEFLLIEVKEVYYIIQSFNHTQSGDHSFCQEDRCR